MRHRARRPSRRSPRSRASGGGSAASASAVRRRHVALLRELCVTGRGVAHRRAVRAGGRGHQPARRAPLPRSSRSTARGGCAGDVRRAARRTVLHPARPRADPGGRRSVFLSGSPPAWVRGAARERAPPWRRSRSVPGSVSPPRSIAAHALAGAADASLACLPTRSPAPLRPRSRVRGSCSCCRLRRGRAGPCGGRRRLADGPARGARAGAAGPGAANPPHRAPAGQLAARPGRPSCQRRSGRHRGARVDGAQGRRAGLRRRLRDRAVDAVRRGEHLSLDDPRAVRATRSRWDRLTPGPVTQTVAAVGYSAAGLAGGLLAAAVAFAPSFCFILLGARRFERLLADRHVLAFLAGAAPAAAGRSSERPSRSTAGL